MFSGGHQHQWFRDSPRASRAKVDGFVINLSINGIGQPPIDLTNKTHSCTITNLHHGSSISAYVLAYADRQLYHKKKYAGRASETAEITLILEEKEENGGEETG